MAGKRIGFVDYKLENWHANTFLRIIRTDVADLGFTVAGCWSQDTADGQAWAAKNNVPWFDSVKKLNEAVDCYMILAPSNPEVHLKLCQLTFPCAKPTYVDKTFAPDVATAKRIFALGDRCGVPMQTTSALRYTNVQAYAAELKDTPVRHLVTWGGGGSFGEYGIHPTELAISVMGPQATRLMRRGTGNLSQLLVDFTDGRTAVINVYCQSNTAFAASVSTDKGTKYIEVDGAKLFVDTARALLKFLEEGKPNIDRAESLMIRRILDVAGKPAALKRFVAL